MSDSKRYFTKNLLTWNCSTNNRPMPWKGESNPYKIWLSEIILQQTRVEQGWDYYNRFVATFPTIESLAKAPEQKVFKLWEGLGYYTRCKNLIATAKFIANEKKGIFPDKYEDILALKGIGPYTAAAIASFAFNLPFAVVDGNVFRVLSRFFGIDDAIDSTAGKKLFTQLANELLESKNPAIYNQSIMDFGAVVCKPKSPLCGECPLKTKCKALLQNKVNALPIKEGKLIKKTRWLNYLIVDFENKIFVRKRGAKDIWENLYEFILLENDTLIEPEALRKTDVFKNIFLKNTPEIIDISPIYKQQLTHQTINGRFIKIKVQQQLNLQGYKTVTYKQLSKLPFPRFINGYLVQNELKG